MKHEGIKLDLTCLLTEKKGSRNLLTLDQLSQYEPKAEEARVHLMEQKESREVGFYLLPYDLETVHEVENYAKDKRDRFKNFVVLGIGGSALGNIALLRSLKGQYYNFRKASKRGGPRVFVLDNVDPEFLADFLGSIRVENTLFNVISKSGSTVETSAQFLLVTEMLKKKLGKKFHKNIVITTDREEGDLRRIAQDYKMKSFVIPKNVGGRFSVLSSVGLLTAAMLDIKIRDLLCGAREMLERCETAPLLENPAFLNSLIHYLMDRTKKKSISVMMSYSNELFYWADWYRQLWAESLGKNTDREGHRMAVGQTPIKALGTTDQHSQLQLYTEGPNDKVFTFLSVEKYRLDLKMPNFGGDYSSLGYLSGKNLSELFSAEMRATEYALRMQNRPSMRLVFPEINEYTVGQFIMLYELSAAFSGELYNINSFDQPGVEAGKKAAYRLLGRKGFEEEAGGIMEKDSERYIL